MRLVKELAIAALVACLPLSAATALTEAEQGQLADLLDQASDVSAGTEVGGAKIIAWNGRLLQGGEACAFSRILNADEICTTTAIVFPPDDVAIDSIYYGAPQEIGHVNMDDWTDDVNSQIDEIWANYVEGSKAQSKRIGYEVVPVRWVLYPTLNKAAKVMTYGILLTFDGEEVINLTTVKFTRSGYVEMNVVTDGGMLAAASTTFDDVSRYASKTYAPIKGTRYADFREGDKIAAVGALGVLASVVGVKYGNKGTLAAIGAVILAFAKKFWFLLLVIPAAIWGAVKKLVGQDDEAA